MPPSGEGAPVKRSSSGIQFVFAWEKGQIAMSFFTDAKRNQRCYVSFGKSCDLVMVTYPYLSQHPDEGDLGDWE